MTPEEFSRIVPRAWIGAAQVWQVHTWWRPRRRKIAVAIQWLEIPTWDDQSRKMRVEMLIDLFVDPSLSIPVEAPAVFGIADRSIAIVTDPTYFRFLGNFSRDWQRINGRVDIVGFDLMGVVGDFYGRRITLRPCERNVE